MREILFRARKVDNTGWADGLLTNMWGQYYIINPSDENTTYLIDPETVCQYTGLTDKNGKKIFDGDIISFDYERGSWGKIAKVLFEDGEYRYRLITNAADLYNCRICGENGKCEVIGNIFDNPELIGDQP